MSVQLFRNFNSEHHLDLLSLKTDEKDYSCSETVSSVPDAAVSVRHNRRHRLQKEDPAVGSRGRRKRMAKAKVPS